MQLAPEIGAATRGVVGLVALALVLAMLVVGLFGDRIDRGEPDGDDAPNVELTE